MEKISTYFIFLKKHVKKPSYWLQLCLLFVMLLVTVNIKPPQAENFTVGVYGDKNLVELLQKQEQSLRFVYFFNKKELYEAVNSVKIDSGFVFSEGWKEGTITYVKSPMTTKGELAKETVFAACYPRLAEKILLEEDANAYIDVYADEKEERQKALLDRYEEYLSGRNLFELEVETEEGIAEVAEASDASANRILACLVVCFLFGLLWFICRRDCRCLQTHRAYGVLRLIYDWSVWTIPFVLWIVYLIGFDEKSGLWQSIPLLLFEFIGLEIVYFFVEKRRKLRIRR